MVAVVRSCGAGTIGGGQYWWTGAATHSRSARAARRVCLVYTRAANPWLDTFFLIPRAVFLFSLSRVQELEKDEAAASTQTSWKKFNTGNKVRPCSARRFHRRVRAHVHSCRIAQPRNLRERSSRGFAPGQVIRVSRTSVQPWASGRCWATMRTHARLLPHPPRLFCLAALQKSKSKNGFRGGKAKDSIFKTPDSHDGKVGVAATHSRAQLLTASRSC